MPQSPQMSEPQNRDAIGPLADDAEFTVRLDDHVARHSQTRVFKMEWAGQRYWVKRASTRGRGRHLFKGAPAQLANNEAQTIRDLYAAGLQVPQVCFECPGELMVTTDIGTTLDRALDKLNEQARLDLLRKAATSLRELHDQNVSHGAAHLRNLTQTSTGSIGFIDLEKGRATDARSKNTGYDLALATYSIYAQFPDSKGLATAFLTAYGPGAARKASAQLAMLLLPLSPLTALLRLHETRYRPQRAYRIYSAIPRARRLLLSGITR